MKSQRSVRVLFITRKFPPSTGGMQLAAYQFHRHLFQVADVRLIKWGGANKWLPLVLPYLLLKSILTLVFKKNDVIYLQDGLLAPVGYLLKVFGKPVFITVHGLDITYQNRLYQFFIPRCIKSFHRVICVSNVTKQQCIKRGIPEEKIEVIPCGVSDELFISLNKLERDKLREKLSVKIKTNLNTVDRKLLLSVGRLVERKGFHWFVEGVMPKIVKDNEYCIYLIAGEGPYRNKIQQSVERYGLKDRVVLLGQANDEMLRLLYNISDVYIMPNISVTGDMEGFGLVALEAASCRLPVVASRLEAIEETINHGKNGFLLEPYKAEQFAETIAKLLEDEVERKDFGEKARQFTLENYSWIKMTDMYLEEFHKALKV